MTTAALCLDCGTATAPRLREAPIEGAWEWYMVHDSVWAAAGMRNAATDEFLYEYLCIGCLEKRLGRTLGPPDFKPLPINDRHRLATPRLRDRLTVRAAL